MLKGTKLHRFWFFAKLFLRRQELAHQPSLQYSPTKYHDYHAPQNSMTIWPFWSFASEACISTCSPGAFRDQNLTQTEGLSVQVEVMEWEVGSEGWVSGILMHLFDMFGTVYIMFTHIRDLYTILFLFTRFVMIWWYLVHAHDEIRRMGLEGVEAWGPPSPKTFKKRELWERSDPSDGFLYSTRSFLLNILYTTTFMVFVLFCYWFKMHKSSRKILSDCFDLRTPWKNWLHCPSYNSREMPPARLAWIFVCSGSSGCRNLIPKDQFFVSF